MRLNHTKPDHGLFSEDREGVVFTCLKTDSVGFGSPSRRQADDYFEATGLAVMAGYRSLARLHARLDDGQAQPHAAGFPGARGVGPVEWREDFVERILRQAGALICHGDQYVFVIATG